MQPGIFDCVYRVKGLKDAPGYAAQDVARHGADIS